jgi:hypothetical protein
MKLLLRHGIHRKDDNLYAFRIPTKSLPTIDLISIGIVSQDGREYYAAPKTLILKKE